jgi:quinol monooxygenase YgiN
VLIIAGKMYVNPMERAEFIEAHRKVVEEARGAPGCVDLAISPDPWDESRVNMHEQWASAEAFEAWRAVSPVPTAQVDILGGDVRKQEVGRAGMPH